MDSEDMYDDSGPSVATPRTAPKKKDEGTSTGLLDESFFQGKELKPGTVCSVKIEKVFGDGQVEVSYVSKESEDESSEDEMEMPSGDAEMEDMMA